MAQHSSEEAPARVVEVARILLSSRRATAARLVGRAAIDSDDVLALHEGLQHICPATRGEGCPSLSLLGFAAVQGDVECFKALFLRIGWATHLDAMPLYTDPDCNLVTLQFAVREHPFGHPFLFNDTEPSFDNARVIVPWVRAQDARRRWCRVRAIARVLLWHSRAVQISNAPGGRAYQATLAHYLHTVGGAGATGG